MNPLDGQPVFSGLDQKKWQQVSVNLWKYVGQKIKLRFTISTDGESNYAGWYIDDLSITSNEHKDAALWSIEEPGSLIDIYMSPVMPMAVVYNAGGVPVDFSVTLDILKDQEFVYQQTWEIFQIYPDKKDTVMFYPWYVEEVGEYKLFFKISATDDIDDTNDSLELKTTVLKAMFSEIKDFGFTEFNPYWRKILWGDYNGDHWPDAFISGDTLMRNQNGYMVTDLLLPPTFENNTLAGLSSCWADINNDEHMDLFVGHYLMGDSTIPGKFLLNHGTYFEDITDQFRLKNLIEIQDVGFFDYDNDGDLDFYAGAFDFRNQLYQNNGTGNFKEVASEVGVDFKEYRFFYPFDFDGDLDPDLLFYGWYPLRLGLMNNKNGKFLDITDSCGFDTSGRYEVYNISVADFNNDGWLDIFFYQGFFINNGDRTFYKQGLPAPQPAFGMGDYEAFDFNNDGLIDILLNVSYFDSQSGLAIYVNNGDLNFSYEEIPLYQKDNVSFKYILDYNNDGYQDIFVSKDLMLRNNQSQNNWLKVDLRGDDCNRFGIGAKIRIEHNGFFQFRELSTGGSLSSPQLPWACFGLRTDEIVDTITVIWPCGHIDQVTGISANRWVTISEGVGVTNIRSNTDLPKFSRLDQNFPNPFNAGTYIRYDIPTNQFLELTIFNILGQKVRTLVDNQMTAGSHRVYWDGKDDTNRAVASGIYIYELKTSNASLRKKMLLVK